MEMSKQKLKSARATTSSNPNPKVLTKTSNDIKSHKLIVKHKTSNSYGGSSSSEKKLSIIKETFSRPSSKPTTDRKLKEPKPKKKLIVHRKSNSISEKPNNPIQKVLQTMHKHKQSIEIKKENNAISKFSYRSNVGMIPGNSSKVNQDSFIALKDLNFVSSLFGVADGHGVYGEYVSKYVKERFPQILLNHPYFLSDPLKSIKSSVSKLNKEICQQEFDTNFSGSTFIFILFRGKKLWCANIGDSRALLAREIQEKSFQSNLLSSNLKSNH